MTQDINNRDRDRLTGIYSRDYFDKVAREILNDNEDVNFAIIEVDINRLTIINELYGVDEGDNVLKYMGQLLDDVFGTVPYSVYARVQADLFVIMCPFDEDLIEEYIEEIEEGMRTYSKRINIDILLSFGVYECVERSMHVQIMRDRAKLALKTVKGNYISHCAYYDQSMHDKITMEQEVVQHMRSALDNREFVVYYQPKHSLDDDRIIGAEALVRWISPERGMISPGIFIPIFEENGFIMNLDQYVWEETCKFIRKLLDEGVQIKPISVNVSRVNLYNSELVDTICKLVEKYNIPPSMLELEFTESAYVDNPGLMLQTMSALQKYGFKVEMDDFGSGYSSLNMLKDVPVDVLKIDLNFLSKTSNSDKAITIMTSILRMSKWLGIPSIVEGVETIEQINYLKSVGATSVQGYYYSRPIPETEYLDYIDKYKKADNSEEKETNIHEDVQIVHPQRLWESITKNVDEEFPLFGCYGLYDYYGDHEEPIRVSDSFYKFFDTSREALSGAGFNARARVMEEDRDIVRDMFEQASTGHKVSEGAFRRIMPDGSYKVVYAKIRLMGMNEAGDAKVFYVGMNDITEYVERFKS